MDQDIEEHYLQTCDVEYNPIMNRGEIMYENKIITEPKWKSWIVQTTTPLFTPEQCNQIIASGRAQKPQQAQVGMNKPRRWN